MKTIKSNREAEKLIKNGVLAIEDDLEIAFDGFCIEADINCHNIYSKDYRRDINAWDIDAGDINARDINARDINAWDITYYAVCFAYNSFKCVSVSGTRENARHFCLDSEIEFKNPDERLTIGKKVKIRLNDGQEVTGTIIEARDDC